MVWPYLHHRAFEDIYFTLYTPQFDVWESPLPFKIGETKNPDNKGLEVTYNNLRMSGSAGVGRTFIADCTVKVQNDDQSWHTYQVSPTFQITKDGPQPTFPEIGHTGLVLSLERLDASDRSANLQVHFKEPIWGIDLFYKPMVILVWVGAGIMTLGGFMAAFYRRPYKIKVEKVRIDRTQEEVDEPGDSPS